jgi:hypothetical protein
MGQRQSWHGSNRNGEKNGCELTDNAAVTGLPEFAIQGTTRMISSQIPGDAHSPGLTLRRFSCPTGQRRSVMSNRVSFCD